MPYITKQYKFCAAHRYWNDGWSKEKNKDVFDKDIHIHGHNYNIHWNFYLCIKPLLRLLLQNI